MPVYIFISALWELDAWSCLLFIQRLLSVQGVWIVWIPMVKHIFNKILISFVYPVKHIKEDSKRKLYVCEICLIALSLDYNKLYIFIIRYVFCTSHFEEDYITIHVT